MLLIAVVRIEVCHVLVNSCLEYDPRLIPIDIRRLKLRSIDEYDEAIIISVIREVLSSQQ